tara:strand:+ start:834 stop:1583 length:750 start_codon:yes stop_codon:yes gene_type:complete
MVTRRGILSGTAGLAAAAALSELALGSDAWAEAPDRDLLSLTTELSRISRCLVIDNFTPVEWHNQLDSTLAKSFDHSTLQQLIRTVDIDQVTDGFDFGEKGRSSRDVDIGMSWERAGKTIKTKLVGIDAGHGIPPHVHENMATATIVLSGQVRLRQFDRLGRYDSSILVRPSVDQVQTAGQWSSISRDRGNLHWFTADDGPVFLLNINIENLGGEAVPGIRVAVEDTPLRSDVHVARFISSDEAEARFG